jgi:hypothetical protein
MIQAVCWKEACKLYSEDVRSRVVGTIEGGTTIPEAAEQCNAASASALSPASSSFTGKRAGVDPAKFGGYKDFKFAESRRSPGFLRDTSNSHTSVMASPSKRRATKPMRERSIAAGRSHRTSGRQRSGNGGKSPKRTAKSPESRQQQWFRVRPIH